MLGLEADAAFWLQLALVLHGGYADLVGYHRDARLRIVAQVALAVGRGETDRLAGYGYGGARGELLEVIALDDSFLLLLQRFDLPVHLAQQREHLGIV